MYEQLCISSIWVGQIGSFALLTGRNYVKAAVYFLCKWVGTM